MNGYFLKILNLKARIFTNVCLSKNKIIVVLKDRLKPHSCN